jgi:purine nucleoside permease
VYYVLDENNKVKKAKHVIHWANAVEKAERLQNVFDDINGNRIIVSTIFTGIDANPQIKRLKLLPFLWETLIIGGLHDQYSKKYCTLEDAVAGHAKAVVLARSGA